MASFSFGAGNAGKLLCIPLYLVGRVATLAIPRSRDLWVFGSAVGVADGAWELWQYATERGERSVWLTGSERDAQDARERSIPHTRKTSLRGFWLTARASVIVLTHGFGDVNRYGATGGIIVQLWHGIPLKRIGLDAAVTTASPVPVARRAVGRLLGTLYRRTQGRIRVLPAASDLVRGRLESAFGLSDPRVPVTGDPRVDVLSRGTRDERRTTAQARIGAAIPELPAGARLVLFAPTWRDGAVDPVVPRGDEVSALHALLEDAGAVLLLRPHPLGVGEYRAALGPRVRMLGSDLVADPTPVLPAIDVLITDYSSMLFDAALAGVPTLYLAPDLEDYERSRGFYGTYRDVAGDEAVRSWGELAAPLRTALTDASERARLRERGRELSARVHAFRDGDNTARVYRAIARLRGSGERP